MTPAGSPVHAAQYLRMSTEHQRYSLQNQSASIRDYGEKEGFVVTQTYADAGKSGVVIARRNGLRRLLNDVVNGVANTAAAREGLYGFADSAGGIAGGAASVEVTYTR
jgi:predicted site-specific integrase-resolvase